MKNIVILLSIIFLAGCSSNYYLSTIEQKGLNGKVKSVSLKFFEAIEKNGDLVKGTEQAGFLLGNNLTIFDKKGYETEYIVYSLNKTSTEYHKTYKYNKKGLLIEEIDYYSNGDIKSKSDYSYKGSNDSLEVTVNNTNAGIIKYVNKYDKNKNLIKNGGITYYYDENNNLIKEENQYSSCIYKYDDNRNMIKKQYVGSYVTINDSFRYIDFDKMGNWTKQIEFREDKARFIVEREFEYY